VIAHPAALNMRTALDTPVPDCETASPTAFLSHAAPAEVLI
jgi:hypothetical protein